MSRIVREPSFFKEIGDDIGAWALNTGRTRSIAFVIHLLLLEPGFQLIVSHRLQWRLYPLPFVGRLLRRLLWYVTSIMTGCYIAPGARIGGGAFIPHPTGIVIGGESVIGRRVALYQHVTIGRRDPRCRGEPTIGDDCRLFAGATLLGRIRVGNNSDVGAGAVVLDDLAANALAVGVPASNIHHSQPEDIVSRQ